MEVLSAKYLLITLFMFRVLFKMSANVCINVIIRFLQFSNSIDNQQASNKHFRLFIAPMQFMEIFNLKINYLIIELTTVISAFIKAQ